MIPRAENRRRAGDQHLVEDGRRIGDDDEQSAADIALRRDPERLHDADGNRAENRHAGDAGRHHEREQKVDDDEAEQKTGVRIAGSAS